MKRKMKISYLARKSFLSAVPFIRIGNKFLRDSAKINIGDFVEVEYAAEGLVIIRKIANV